MIRVNNIPTITHPFTFILVDGSVYKCISPTDSIAGSICTTGQAYSIAMRVVNGTLCMPESEGITISNSELN